MNARPKLPLLDHELEAPSAFTPEALIEAVRRERGLAPDPVPEVCVLEFDGDLTDWLVARSAVCRYEPWACFHTSMYALETDGSRCGIVPRTIGGPYAVLIAEQLAASGAKVILGLTSAGRVCPGLPIPSLVVAAAALRDEGTSYHYLPPANVVAACPDTVGALQAEMRRVALPVFSGPVWTTDAPYRETREQLGRHAGAGVLAVEMQAASLFAFGASRNVRVGLVAHVSNAIDHAGEPFDKGGYELGSEILKATCRAGARILGRCGG